MSGYCEWCCCERRYVPLNYGFLLDVYDQEGLPDHVATLFLVFLGTSMLFSIMVCSTLYSYQPCSERFPFLQTLQHLLFRVSFLMMAIQLFLKKPSNYFLIGTELIFFDNHIQNDYMLI